MANENINPQLEPLCGPISVLKLDEKNARKHGKRSIEAIKKSYEVFQQNKPIVALADGTVISGNGQLAAALALGWERIAFVTFVDEEKARAFALADNRSAELSEWDEAALPDAIAEVEASAPELIDAIGWTTKEREDVSTVFTPTSDAEQGKLDVRAFITCPSCGEEFQKK